MSYERIVVEHNRLTGSQIHVEPRLRNVVAVLAPSIQFSDLFVQDLNNRIIDFKPDPTSPALEIKSLIVTLSFVFLEASRACLGLFPLLFAQDRLEGVQVSVDGLIELGNGELGQALLKMVGRNNTLLKMVVIVLLGA